MDRLEELHNLLHKVETCDKCRAKSSDRWFFPPNQLPEIMLISETPGPYPLNQSLDGIPHPTRGNSWFWGLVKELFGDRFRPKGDDKTKSTVYWTHYQKCSKMMEDKKTLRYLGADCANRYLDCEIRLVDPKLIVALGMNTGELLVERYHLTPLARVECLTRKSDRPLRVKVGTFQTRDNREYAILCHPSYARRRRGCTVFQNEYRELIKKSQAAIDQLIPQL